MWYWGVIAALVAFYVLSIRRQLVRIANAAETLAEAARLDLRHRYGPNYDTPDSTDSAD